ncbi:MAG TPA: S8 family serine peptidase [Stenotrophomonas sp.]
MNESTLSIARHTLALAVCLALAGSPEARADIKATPGLTLINAEHAYARGLDGRGQAIALLDSGVHVGHPELAGRVFGLVMQGRDKDGKLCESSRHLTGDKACFRSDGGRPIITYTDWNAALLDMSPQKKAEAEQEAAWGRHHEHGTHVAGTMVAARDGKGVQGVAPEARLFSLALVGDDYMDMPGMLDRAGGKVLSVERPTEALKQGYAALRKANVRAINHSWGFRAEGPDTVATVDAQFKKHTKEIETIAAATLGTGLIQVWAAGNDAGASADVLAALPRYIPALEPHWLSVVSANAAGKLDITSSRCGLSRDWCVAAPGEDILSSVVSGQAQATPVRDAQGQVVGLEVAAQQRPVTGLAKMGGTSMSAPHVTASLALLMQRYPYLNNAGIRDVLLTTARDLGAPGVDDIFGWGMVDLRKAIDGPGQLRVDMTVNMDRPGGGTPVWSGPAWDDWRNAIGGSGRLIKQGPGWLRLSGDNRFGGAVVDGGTLEFSGNNALSAPVSVSSDGNLHLSGRMAGSAIEINGGRAWIGGQISGAPVRVRQGGRLQLAERGRIEGGGLQLMASQARVDGQVAGRIDVDAGSRLDGNGQLGPTWIAGTIAPGHSIGTLTIAGDYVQQPGSVYEAEVATGGQSDLLQVEGQARLQGGTLRVLPTDAGALLGQRWRVLAARNLEGRFAAVEGALATPFLAFAAHYEGNAIQAQVRRGRSLASAARTRNQRSVAGAVDRTPDNHVLPQRLTQLQAAQLPAALDPLSGELHASVRALLLQDTQATREAALARARHGQDTFTAQSAAGKGHGLWADVHQGQRRLDSDGNADSARLSGSTALVGYDQAFDSGWQAGLFGGGGKRSAGLSARYDRADIKATHAGLHVSQRWGQLGARAGLLHSWQQVNSRRQVPGAGGDAAAQAQARYEVNISQWFVDLGYRWERARGGIEPFVQYAGLRLRSQAAQERGGEAPLAVAAARQALGLWSGGLRFGFDLAGRGQVQDWLSLRGSLAYQRAEGDLTPAAKMQWRQGPGFTVWGAPLAKNSTLASLGLAARLTEHSLLELNWRAAFASNARDNSLGLRYSMRF